MSSKHIAWWIPKIGKKEYKYLKQALDNDFPNEGKLTERFQKRICKLLGIKYAVAVNNCTSAIFLSLKALNIDYGDEVIVPDLTFIATANAVEMTGAKPVLVDVEPNKLTISLKMLKTAITKKTKAIIPVHVSGRGADMVTIRKFARSRNISIVEDAAEAFLSRHRTRFLGTYGVTGCFSFSPHKIITTGQGGIIVTNNAKIHKRLIELKDQGRPVRGTGGDDRHNAIGYNFKFTDLQAAVGLGQLTLLKKRIIKMKRIYRLYKQNLNGLRGIKIFDFDIDKGEIPQWVDAWVEKRDLLDNFLRNNGVHCRRFWFPIHTQLPYRQNDDNFPNSTRVSPHLLWLPSAFTLTDKDILLVCKLIRKFLKYEV